GPAHSQGGQGSEALFLLRAVRGSTPLPRCFRPHPLRRSPVSGLHPGVQRLILWHF
ncbi:unnamed protein product, partial [Closterium sp. Yama58-4]